MLKEELKWEKEGEGRIFCVCEVIPAEKRCWRLMCMSAVG